MPLSWSLQLDTDSLWGRFNFVKITFSVQVPRRLQILFKPIQLGYAEVKLGDLLNKSEIVATLPVFWAGLSSVMLPNVFFSFS